MMGAVSLGACSRGCLNVRRFIKESVSSPVNHVQDVTAENAKNAAAPSVAIDGIKDKEKLIKIHLQFS